MVLVALVFHPVKRFVKNLDLKNPCLELEVARHHYTIESQPVEVIATEGQDIQKLKKKQIKNLYNYNTQVSTVWSRRYCSNAIIG